MFEHKIVKLINCNDGDFIILMNHDKINIEILFRLNGLYLKNDDMYSHTIKTAIVKTENADKGINISIEFNKFNYKVYLKIVDLDEALRNNSYDSFCREISFDSREKLNIIKEKYRLNENRRVFDEYQRDKAIGLLSKSQNNVIEIIDEIYHEIIKYLYSNTIYINRLLK